MKFFRQVKLISIQKALCWSYIGYIAFIFLLSFHNGYIDLTVTKRAVFLYGSSAFCAMMSILCLIQFLQRWLRHEKLFSSRKDLVFILIVSCMAAFWGIGMLFCSDPYHSFWGDTYKCTGLLLYLLGALSICFLGCYLEWNRYMTGILFLSTFIICQLQVLNRWEVDPLYMYTTLLYYEHPQFISTLGNTNYNGAFDCLLLGVLMPYFFQCENFKRLLACGACLLVVFAGAICTASDVVFICIAVIFLLLVGFAIKNPMKWFRIVTLLILFLIPCGVFPCFYHNGYEHLYIWDIMSEIFNGHYFKYGVLGVLLLIAVLFFGFGFLSKYREGLFLSYKILLLTGVVFLCSCVIFANSTLIAADQNTLLSHLTITDSWGNDRGDLWKRFLTLFCAAPLANKLFGFGFNNVCPALETIGLGIRENESIADAHNIYFNTLITSGIAGCIMWCLLIGFLFCLTFRHLSQKNPVSAEDKHKKKNACIVLVGLISILIQGIVIGPQIITTPIILIEFGIFYSFFR